MPYVTDPEAVDYLAGLLAAEGDGAEPVGIFLGPFSLFTVIAAVQLAARHPAVSEAQRAILRAIAEDMRAAFAGTPGEAILARGADPAEDWRPGHTQAVPAAFASVASVADAPADAAAEIARLRAAYGPPGAPEGGPR